jgi:hypothetical protein
MERHRDEPFFAYLPYLTCHAPLKAPEPYIAKYREKGLSENLSILYGMVDHLDHHMGRLLQALEDLGLSENTLVIFLSDNGPAVINNYLDEKDRRTRYVNGFRGHKGNIWENGIKSPLFVRWSGQYQPRKVEHLTDVTDIFPTLLDLAGVPAGEIPGNLDGRSVVSYLEEAGECLPGKEVFLYANPGWPPTDKPWTPEGVKDEYRPWKYGGGDNLSYEKQIIGIRNEEYKILLNPGEAGETIARDEEGYVLVDIRRDPQERTNIALTESESLQELKRSLKRWYRDVYRDEHAFEMPVFRIGSDSGTAYPVLAYGPRLTSASVSSASSFLTRFSAPGDWATYDIEVEAAGTYTLELDYRWDSGEEALFRLETGGQAVELTVTGGKSRIEIPGVDLPQGLQRMTLSKASGLATEELKIVTLSFRTENP